MKTIASLAERLDMSAEDALETLRKLHMPVDSVHAEIHDDQCDILMDIDENPSRLEELLHDIEKKEEAKRKKTERLLKGAKKAAEAKKKAEAEPKKKAPKKEPAEAEPAAVEDAVPAPAQAAVIIVEEPAAPEPVEEPAAPEPVEAEPEVVVEPAEASAAAEPPAEVPPVVIHAQILRDDEFPVLAHGDEDHPAAPLEPHAPMGALAEAELRQRTEDERRKKREKERPLPVPDPAVVAEVIRRAQEREAEKNRLRAPRPAPGSRQATTLTDTPFGDADLGRPRTAGVRTPRPGATPERAPLKPAPAGGGPRGDKKKKGKRSERGRALDETMRREAAAAVRGIQAFGPLKKRKKRRDRDGEMEEMEELSGGVVEVEESMTVEQLAHALELEASDIILELMEDNILAHKNQRIELDTIRKIAERHNYEVVTVIPEEAEVIEEEADSPEDLVPRAPVVTVMGHVDHGKTSLLDVVRKANVVAGEAGGITQHIAAYDVAMRNGRVVFLDTPGHEAFTAMRARGAQVTDLVVLVVAADDGVKPQTIEAIDHAKAAGVKIVVAINKCDKADAQPDRVRQELTQFGLVDEQWGGETFMKNISCHTKLGIDELMEMLVLTAELLELKANPAKRGRGTVVESEILRGQGAVAWVLVQNGTLKVGDAFLCGTTYGRVRTLTSSRGESIEAAGPATPVLVTGFSAPPNAGDQFIAAIDERVARSVAEKRAGLERQKRGPSVKHMTLEDFHARMSGVEQKALNVILKADVQGSVDAIASSFAKLGNEEVSINIVHSGVGAVNESDVMLASASDAVIIAFTVSSNAKAQKAAAEEGVEIRTYRIIYEAIDEVKKALEGLLTPESQEVVTGHAEVRQVFRSSAVGNIAGCIQQDGETLRGGLCRIVRDGVIVHTGTVATIRRAKDDVRTVAAGYECGMKIDRFDDLAVGDVIESYKIESVAKKLV